MLTAVTRLLFVVNKEKAMSDLALFNQNLPSHLRTAELDETTKALMGGSGGGSKRISIEGGVWRMLVNGKEVAQNEDRAMNVVIVAAAQKISRIFYAGTYKKGVVSAPDCWSADGETPDAKAKAPQSKVIAVLAASSSVWQLSWRTTLAVTCISLRCRLLLSSVLVRMASGLCRHTQR
jgi:hypothetical protein